MPTASCRDHFREIASRYRAVRSLDVRAVRRIAKALARLVPAQGERGLRLLDVGTGTGRYLVALCEALRELGVPIARAGRLYTAAALRGALERSRMFRSIRLRIAAWWQLTSVPTLLRQARARHYSTFRFYAPREFERALERFRARVRRAYRFPWAIPARDRKSTRLNSSHGYISYAVFCLKKKKNNTRRDLSALD